MKRLAVGILAHVDAGKTTLSEAMLYAGGMIRHLGRVDKGDAFLDTYELEKKRGITIFSKQARLAWDDMDVTLLDTPGHVDFSAEMERVLQVLDYAVLVISGSDGVQGHTRTLWRLLARYQIPAFLFINKMDLAPGREQEVLRDLKESLGGNFVDFGADWTESFYEEAAVSGEAELEEFLETGQVSKDAIRSRIASRDPVSAAAPAQSSGSARRQRHLCCAPYAPRSDKIPQAVSYTPWYSPPRSPVPHWCRAHSRSLLQWRNP